jgi:hypothetical protein
MYLSSSSRRLTCNIMARGSISSSRIPLIYNYLLDNSSLFIYFESFDVDRNLIGSWTLNYVFFLVLCLHRYCKFLCLLPSYSFYSIFLILLLLFSQIKRRPAAKRSFTTKPRWNGAPQTDDGSYDGSLISRRLLFPHSFLFHSLLYFVFAPSSSEFNDPPSGTQQTWTFGEPEEKSDICHKYCRVMWPAIAQGK